MRYFFFIVCVTLFILYVLLCSYCMRYFVYIVCITFSVSLPLGVIDWLQLVIVALPGLFIKRFDSALWQLTVSQAF